MGNHLTNAVARVFPSKVLMLFQCGSGAINTLKAQLRGKKLACLGTDLWYRFRRANSCLQLSPSTDSISVHDLEFERETYSNFKNVNTALNSYTLVKRHPVNIHIHMEDRPKIQPVSNSAGKHSPAVTHQDVLFASLILCPSHEQDFCHWEPENGLSQILFFNLKKESHFTNFLAFKKLSITATVLREAVVNR